MTRSVNKKSPTRIDLCGGTLDIFPLYLLIENPTYVINLSISLFTHCEIRELYEENNDNEIWMISKDQTVTEKYNTNSNGKLLFHEAIIKSFGLENESLQIITDSDVPKGSGLGGSSSLLISMVKAVNEYLSLELTREKIRTIAQNIETSILKVPTGTQDYFGALGESLNIIRYSTHGVEIETIPSNSNFDKFLNKFFETMTLIYTGVSHSSAIENWHIFQSMINEEQETQILLRQLQDISNKIYDTIINCDLIKTIELIDQEWKIRRELLPNMENKEMKEIRNSLESENLIYGLKGCGAGAGGSMIVFSGPNNKGRIREIVEQQNGKILNFNPI